MRVFPWPNLLLQSELLTQRYYMQHYSLVLMKIRINIEFWAYQHMVNLVYDVPTWVGDIICMSFTIYLWWLLRGGKMENKNTVFNQCFGKIDLEEAQHVPVLSWAHRNITGLYKYFNKLPHLFKWQTSVNCNRKASIGTQDSCVGFDWKNITGEKKAWT